MVVLSTKIECSETIQGSLTLLGKLLRLLLLDWQLIMSTIPIRASPSPAWANG
ncbi:uncharacterized protein AKAW2_30100S [Aspergillus luchuensis]|uniref:Uncharacterized protein n=1 Tax=Aspergillus kawachii TaxID=1069201 RepID=A0A7R7W5Q6_ASPKA|nr:uncharacterized protein AKAW2_30100S [Aspergillus luchuensis]BCR96781.1 hypothetical protein AKAW2_30100S [Aspergillus luchuensis]